MKTWLGMLPARWPAFANSPESNGTRHFVKRMSAATAFEKMQEKEVREKTYLDPRWPKDKLFRRKGKVGSYKEEMPSEVLEAFLAQSADTLRRCGYALDRREMPGSEPAFILAKPIQSGRRTKATPAGRGRPGQNRLVRKKAVAHPHATNDFLRPKGRGADWARARRTLILPGGAVEPEIARAIHLIDSGQFPAAFAALNGLKSRQSPARHADYLRALCFLEKGRIADAGEALKEELRWFPDNAAAAALLAELDLPAGPALAEDPELREWLGVIRGYTMVGEPRLRSLHALAKAVCEEDLPGNFVECGVAAGGSSALLAAVIGRHSRRPRRLCRLRHFQRDAGILGAGPARRRAGERERMGSGDLRRAGKLAGGSVREAGRGRMGGAGEGPFQGDPAAAPATHRTHRAAPHGWRLVFLHARHS